MRDTAVTQGNEQMSRRSTTTDFAAPQQKAVDDVQAIVVAAAKTPQENTMENKNFFSHVQQMGNEWAKLMTESASRFSANLEEFHKLEKQGVAKALSAVDEAGRVAKEAINVSEQISAQWRKAAAEYTQRTLDLITPKN
jgi:hypothetical protein